MPSINLLPENFTIEAYKKREKIAVYVLAVFFLFITALISVWIITRKQVEAKNSKVLDAEITQVKSEITRNVESSSLLASEYSKNDIDKLLKEHVYYSKGMDFLKGSIIKDAYVTDIKFSPDDSNGYNVKVDLAAKDFDVMANQLSVFQDSFWITSFAPGEIKLDKDLGVIVEVKMAIRKDLFIFHDQYWDFGVNFLAANCNRYIEIDSYSVTLKKDNDKITGEETSSVVVNFDGKSFDPSKIDEFEKKISGNTDVVESEEIKKVSLPTDKPGTTGFHGNLVLKH
jgi:hypothetical protein